MSKVVAPFTGAWIEILLTKDLNKTLMSLPSRGRGLKYQTILWQSTSKSVAPFTGAWIEMLYQQQERQSSLVAPFTGAWIEIHERKQHVS